MVVTSRDLSKNNQAQAQFNLLVVDDEERILSAIRRSFYNRKFRVFTAISAQKGLEILQQHNIQVVLSDFKMPVMDGGQLLKEVKLKYPHIVSMILTGYADFDAAVDVMNAGAAFKFLSKPWTTRELVNEVEGAFVEYHRRTAQRAAESLIDCQQSAQKIMLEQSIEALTEKGEPFAVVSLRVDDIAMLALQFSDQDDAYVMEHIEKIVEQRLPATSQLYYTEPGQLFVLLQDGLEQSGLHNRLSDLYLEIVKRHSISGVECFINCSISYALAPCDGQTVAQLLPKLRRLMTPLDSSLNNLEQQSKIVRLDKRQRDKSQRRLQIQSAIQTAVSGNHFELYYQPQVRLSDMSIERAEILIRWHHQQLGWISPSEFICLSELDGQIEDIGTWVIAASVKSAWQLQERLGAQLRFSVNISPKQLYNQRIVEQFSELFAIYPIDPSSIELEITESAVIDDMDVAVNTLWQLKLLGMTIAIDDFGAGHTSLSYLSKLPIDVLKLDKSLLDNINSMDTVYDEDNHAILASLIEMAAKLELAVVAEGVENVRQLDALKALGCDYAQGWFFSKAIEHGEFVRLYQSQPFSQMR